MRLRCSDAAPSPACPRSSSRNPDWGHNPTSRCNEECNAEGTWSKRSLAAWNDPRPVLLQISSESQWDGPACFTADSIIEYHCSWFKWTVSSTGTSKLRHFQVPVNLLHPLLSQVPRLISLQSKPKVFLLVWSLALVFFCIYLHPNNPSSATDFSTLVHLQSWPDCLLCH